MTDTAHPAPPASPPEVVDAVIDTVVELGTTLWAARPPSELLQTVKAVERLKSVLLAAELQVVAEIEATRAAASEGWASTRDFVTAVSGGRKGEGRRLVSMAKAVTTERAATGAALASGSISRAQAEVVVEAVDRLPVDPDLREAAEQLLLEEARTSDASDLARAGRYVLDRLDPEGVDRRDERALEREERAAHLGRFLSISEDGIGGVRLKGRGTVEDAAHLKALLFPLAAPQPSGEPGTCGGTPATQQSSPLRSGACGVADCAHDGRDPREHGTRMWDALVEAARLLSSTQVLPTSHGAPPRIGVTLGYDALRTGLGECRLDTGETLSAAAVRRLACDAEILSLVLGSQSQLLDVGRSSRLVTLGLWLALVARDRHCAFPGCSRPPVACDAHHIRHWADGGPTALANMALLCRAHHTMVHTTPWEVRLAHDDERPEFLPPACLDPARRPLRRRPLRE
jgi:hypothetical protein